jgi:predicted nucleic-acid-binding protein
MRATATVILQILKQPFVSRDIYISSHAEAWAAYGAYETGNADFSDYFIAHINKK